MRNSKSGALSSAAGGIARANAIKGHARPPDDAPHVDMRRLSGSRFSFFASCDLWHSHPFVISQY
jgi:hypothetical protein